MILGIDIGSTKISVSLWSPQGDMPEPPRRFATREGGFEANFGEILRLGRELLAQRELRAVGVSAGGPVDPERGVLLDMPNRRGWRDAPLAARIGESLGVPVAVENDANAGALAEWHHGAGRGADDLVFLTLSTGIGAGLILGGRLYRGHRFMAGEVGHHVVEPGGALCGCGQHGCLEAYASGAGIARRLDERRRADPDLPETAREVVERARQGDSVCAEILAEVARYLARGIATLVFVLNPGRVVLGTIAVGAGELLLAPLRDELSQLVWPSLLEGLELRTAELESDLGDHAAYAVARAILQRR